MRLVCCCLVLFCLADVAMADDDVKPEEMKKLYNQTLVQLKAAQDRKAELAAENQKLSAHVADLQKQLVSANSQNDELKRQVAEFADRTFALRNHYAAWLKFITTNPAVEMEWDIFLDRSAPITPSTDMPLIDREWPFSAKG